VRRAIQSKFTRIILSSILLLALSSHALAESISELEAWRYDASASEWKRLPNFPKPEGGLGVVEQLYTAIVGESLYLFIRSDKACTDGTGACRANAASFDTRTLRWTPVSTERFPLGRRRMLFIQDGTELFFLGSKDQRELNPPIDMGASYSTESKSWSLIPDLSESWLEHGVGVPFGDGRIAIWGTPPGQYPRSTGAIYDRNRKRWSEIAEMNAPSAAWTTFAGWTGKELIVWGGRSEFGCTPAGGIYDPETNKWTAMTSAGAPTGCDGPLTFLAGRSLLVWGGVTKDSVQPGAGGIYSIDSANWSEMPTAGAPSFHLSNNSTLGFRGSWMAGRLVVFRFKNEGEALRCSGSIFDSAEKSWRPFEHVVRKEPPYGHEVSYGLDRLERDQLRLYAIADQGSNCFSFPQPPAPIPNPEFILVRTDSEQLLRTDQGYFFFRTLIQNRSSQ